MTPQNPSSQNPTSEQSSTRRPFPLLRCLFDIPHLIIDVTARELVSAAKEDLSRPTHKLTRWMVNIIGWSIVGGVPVLLLWPYVGTPTRERGRRAGITECEASHNITTSHCTTRTVTLEDIADRICDSKMPQVYVDRLPAVDIPRKVDEKFLTLFDNEEFQTVVVLGPKRCGKSTLVIKALKDRQAVVKIEGFSTETVDTILGRIGEAGSRDAAKKAVAICKHKGRKPIIICEYKMTGREEDHQSTFKELLDTAKIWQCDEGICRVVFVLSDATLSSSVSEDPTRWTGFWVGNFEIVEAKMYLQQRKISDDDIPQYLDHLGTRPTDLLDLVNSGDKKQFIMEKEQEAREIIETFRDDPVHSTANITLMQRMLKEGRVSQKNAWSIMNPTGMDAEQQQESLLHFLKKHHLYQLMNRHILFHSRINERVAQEMYEAENLVSGSCDNSQNPIKHILSHIESNLQHNRHANEVQQESSADQQQANGIFQGSSSYQDERKMMERSRMLSKHFFHDKDDQFIAEQLNPFFQNMNISQRLPASNTTTTTTTTTSASNFLQQSDSQDQNYDFDVDLTQQQQHNFEQQSDFFDQDVDYVEYFKKSFDLNNITKSTLHYQPTVPAQENPYRNHDDAFELGTNLWQRGELKKCVLALEAAVVREPQRVEAWKLLGTAQAESDNDEKAIQAYTKAHEHNPQDLDTLLELGVSYTNELNKIRALVFLKTWLESHPKYSSIVKQHPSTQRTFENDEQMVSWKFSRFDQDVTDMFLQASKLNPNDAELHLVLGVLYNISDNYENAIDSLRKAVQVRPNYHTVWNRLGATLANHQRSEEAIECYRKALKLKPNYIRAWVNLGIVHSNMDQHVEALKFYFRALKMCEDSEHIWNYISMSFSCLNRDDLVDLCDQKNADLIKSKFPALME